MKQLIPALLAALCLLLGVLRHVPCRHAPHGGRTKRPSKAEASESTGPWAPTGERCRRKTPSPIC